MTAQQKKPAEGFKAAVAYETIDGDGHTTMGDPEWWKPYLPKKYWDWAPKRSSQAGEEGQVEAEGRVYRLPLPYPGTGSGRTGGLMTPGGWKLEDLASVSIEKAAKMGGADPKDRLEAMDADGVNISYMYPSELLSLSWAVSGSSFATALAAAYNDWLADYCLTDPHRLRGAAIIPQHDMVLAVEEVERVHTRGLKTVMIRPNTVAGQNLDHPNFERLWATLQDLGIGVGIHEGFGVEMPTLGIDRCNNWMQAHAFEHPAEHMMATMLMITGGVLQRYPKLQVGFLENGAGWAPFWLNHLDEHHEKWSRFYPGLDEKPSFYFKRQCYLGVEPDYALIPHLVESGLEDTLIFSTDFPHFDAIYPGSVAAMVDRKDLSDEVKRKALRDNALRLYGATR